jgi:predicted TIM-barrel fold metal-dependent hydrolase
MSDNFEWLVSVDDHVIEPGHVWQQYVPQRFRDDAPKLLKDDDGYWRWHYDGRHATLTSLGAVAGTPRSTWSPMPLDWDNLGHPAYVDPKSRIEIMNTDGVLASLVFPMFPRFCGQTFLEASDKDVALACVQGYNDWMIDEWCGSAPGRFIPLAIVPMWDPELAAAETRRVSAKGAKSIAFSENPTKLGLPSIHDADRHWDPLFQACAETGAVVSIHVGSSSEIRSVSKDAPLVSSVTFIALTALDTLIDWMWSGNLIRYPDLKLCLSESGVSWVPTVLERIRRDVDRQQWARAGEGTFSGNLLTGDARPVANNSVFGDIPGGFDPLEVFHRSVYTCVIADDYVGDSLDYLGYDNVLIETDYPHSDSSYPHSAELASKHLAGLSAENRAKILRDNACRVFDFTPADTADLPQLTVNAPIG